MISSCVQKKKEKQTQRHHNQITDTLLAAASSHDSVCVAKDERRDFGNISCSQCLSVTKSWLFFVSLLHPSSRLSIYLSFSPSLPPCHVHPNFYTPVETDFFNSFTYLCIPRLLSAASSGFNVAVSFMLPIKYDNIDETVCHQTEEHEGNLPLSYSCFSLV